MAQRSARGHAGATFSALLTSYERDPKNAVQRRLHGYDKVRLKRAFGRSRLRDLTEDRIIAYGLAREASGAAATIVNDELRTLGMVLAWARAAGRLAVVPAIWFLRVERKPVEWKPRFMPGSGGADISYRRWQPLVMSPSPHERPAKRGKLSEDALKDHLSRHSIDKMNRDGSRFSDQQRVDALKREQDITISRPTLVRRLKPYRRSPQ